MKKAFVIGTFTVLSLLVTGCNKSVDPTGKAIVGAWDCHTTSAESSANINLADTKTFGADGQFSSSKFPVGKTYKYRLEGDKLITVLPQGDWIEKVTNLTTNSLEYFNDKSGKPINVSCQKKS